MTPEEALKWIANILNQNNIPYRIGGGMAMRLYGSTRPVHDIDISISGSDFTRIIPLVKDAITAGPKQYKNEKWDCTTLSLFAHGYEIDLTDVDTLLMSNKQRTSWIRNKTIYDAYPDTLLTIDGVTVRVMNPHTLLAYKNELDGEHQEEDVAFLKEIIQRRHTR